MFSLFRRLIPSCMQQIQPHIDEQENEDVNEHLQFIYSTLYQITTMEQISTINEQLGLLPNVVNQLPTDIIYYDQQVNVPNKTYTIYIALDELFNLLIKYETTPDENMLTLVGKVVNSLLAKNILIFQNYLERCIQVPNNCNDHHDKLLRKLKYIRFILYFNCNNKFKINYDYLIAFLQNVDQQCNKSSDLTNMFVNLLVENKKELYNPDYYGENITKRYRDVFAKYPVLGVDLLPSLPKVNQTTTNESSRLSPFINANNINRSSVSTTTLTENDLLINDIYTTMHNITTRKYTNIDLLDSLNNIENGLKRLVTTNLEFYEQKLLIDNHRYSIYNFIDDLIELFLRTEQHNQNTNLQYTLHSPPLRIRELIISILTLICNKNKSITSNYYVNRYTICVNTLVECDNRRLKNNEKDNRIPEKTAMERICQHLRHVIVLLSYKCNTLVIDYTDLVEKVLYPISSRYYPLRYNEQQDVNRNIFNVIVGVILTFEKSFINTIFRQYRFREEIKNKVIELINNDVIVITNENLVKTTPVKKRSNMVSSLTRQNQSQQPPVVVAQANEIINMNDIPIVVAQENNVNNNIPVAVAVAVTQPINSNETPIAVAHPVTNYVLYEGRKIQTKEKFAGKTQKRFSKKKLNLKAGKSYNKNKHGKLRKSRQTINQRHSNGLSRKIRKGRDLS